MAEKKKEPTPEAEPKEAATPPPPPEEAEDAGVQISQWEFINEIPTRERVVELLETLPSVWGVKTVDYADYVQVLPQTKKVKVPDGDNRKREVYLDCYTIYMSVAGRLKMLEEAAENNGWQVDFVPEPGCSIPGFIDLGDASGRIVYREYVKITAWLEGKQDTEFGSKPGMAWVPFSGGRQAAGSNPYEKCETAARGRALAAWGFGVLPGSGVASVEEVLGSAANQRAMEREGGPQTNGRISRDALMQRLYQAAEQVRQGMGWEVSRLQEHMGEYLTRKPGGELPGLGISGAFDVDAGQVVFSKVTDGNLQLLTTHMEHELERLKKGEQPI